MEPEQNNAEDTSAQDQVQDQNQDLSGDDEIAAILGHDAFASGGEEGPDPESAPKGKKTSDDGAEAAGADGEEERPKEAAGSKPSESEKGKDPKAVEESEEEKRLKESLEKSKPSEVETLKSQLEDMRRQMAELATPKPAVDQSKEAQEFQALAQKYPAHVPDEMLNALFPDMEPEQKAGAKQALGFFATSLAASVHANVAKQVAEQVAQQVQQRVVQDTSVQTQRQARLEQVRQDFYGKFPQLENFVPLVTEEAVKLQKETGISDWSPEFRDALGSRVIRRLQAAGFATPAQPGNGASQPAHQARPGARPSAPANSPEEQITNEILSTFQ